MPWSRGKERGNPCAVKFTPTEIPDVVLVEPRLFRDDRGFFFESYHQHKFAEGGIEVPFVQDNHARSAKGTLRGLHYQAMPGQAKLVRALRGRIWDVAVDIRPGSPTFGNWVAEELDEENPRWIFVPVGFAHGYVALTDCEVEYKVSAFYDGAQERGIAWDDPDLGVKWPVDEPILSERDRGNPSFREVFPQS